MARSSLKPWFAWIVICLLSCGACGKQGRGRENSASPANGDRVDVEEVSPRLVLQGEDYVRARDGFKTRLTRRGPSPQPWKPLRVPRGAVEIDYASGDLELKAFVGPPPDESKKWPAVLFLHGGFAFDDRDWEMSQPYRDAGFVVLVPILRGENGQDGNYTLFYDEVEDVLAAAESLAQLHYVDDNRIFLAGHSAGGTLALLASMVSRRFRAAASISGFGDQIALARLMPSLVVFDATDTREFLLRSPIAFATSIKCPTRLYCGDQEAFLVKSNERLASWARRDGLDVSDVTIPGDGVDLVATAVRDSIRFFEGMQDRRAP